MNNETTNEDLELIRSNMILQIVLQIIEQDSKVIYAHDRQALQPLYHMMFDHTKEAANTVLSGIKREMFKRGVKIESTKRTTKEFTANYLCRGSFGEYRLDWPTIKEEAAKRMKAYMSNAN